MHHESNGSYLVFYWLTFSGLIMALSLNLISFYLRRSSKYNMQIKSLVWKNIERTFHHKLLWKICLSIFRKFQKNSIQPWDPERGWIILWMMVTQNAKNISAKYNWKNKIENLIFNQQMEICNLIKSYFLTFALKIDKCSGISIYINRYINFISKIKVEKL